MKKTIMFIQCVVGGILCLLISLNNRTEKIKFNDQHIEGYSLGNIVRDESETVVVRYDLNYEALKVSTTFRKKVDSRNLTRIEKRVKGRQYHYQRNLIIAEELELKNKDNVYISKYFPCIEVFYTAEDWTNEYSEVYEISKSDYLDQATVFLSEKTTPHLNSALHLMGAYEEVFETKKYRGSGIKVGILDTGVLDKNNEVFSETKVTVRDEWFYFETVTTHATNMAAIIAGKNGIAPEAELFSVEAFGGLSGEIDWLLENDVDLVNMSMGQVSSKGVYDNSYTSVVDYAVYHYNLLFLISTGNNGAEVSNPALAYNAIGVGSGHSNATASDFSAYIVNDGPQKPNIVTNGDLVWIRDLDVDSSGTSPACAIATGVSALMLEQWPIVKESPQMFMSALMMAGYSGENLAFAGSIGSGFLRYDYLMEFIGNTYIETNNNISPITVVFIENVTMRAGDTIKAALGWLAYPVDTSSRPLLTDYDLRLFDSNGSLVAYSQSSGNPYEVLQYTATVKGEYSLTVRQYGTNQSYIAERLSLTYRHFEA